MACAAPPAKKACRDGQLDFSDCINFTDLISQISTEEGVVDFCQTHGLLPKSAQCPNCRIKLDLKKEKTKSEIKPWRYRFICNKTACRKSGNYRVEVFKNTFFEGLKISLKKALVLVYLFAQKSSIDHAIFETSGPQYQNQESSKETVVDFFRHCREVCVESVYYKEGFRKIGGPNCSVEIDEVQFGKRRFKCKQGRVVAGQWVLWGICKETRECFLVPVADLSEETFLEVIVRKVEKETIVKTSCFTSVDKLTELGYHLVTIDDSEIDPKTGACTTNKIESTWWAFKRSLQTSHVSKANYLLHLGEYMWRRKHDKKRQFVELLRDIARVYPGVDSS